jgi:hypothetical protein
MQPEEAMAKAKKEGPKQAYLVVKPLRHDQKHYYPKSHVELTAEEAKPLLEIGVIEAIKGE